MKKAVLIFDLDKLTKEEWKKLFKGAGDYVIKIKQENREKIIKAIEQIEENL